MYNLFAALVYYTTDTTAPQYPMSNILLHAQVHMHLEIHNSSPALDCLFLFFSSYRMTNNVSICDHLSMCIFIRPSHLPNQITNTFGYVAYLKEAAY